MSVFTTVSQTELEFFLTHYNVGELREFRGISEGIENTNYFVTTMHNGLERRFVLTLFETLVAEDIPWYLELMRHLNDSGVPSAAPIADKSGCLLLPLCGKPATLVQRLGGGENLDPEVPHCQSLGLALGQMHVAGLSFTEEQRRNGRDLQWCKDTLQKVMSHISAEDAQLVLAEISFQERMPRSELPQGVVHADLFRDNALMDGEQVAGIIDFYFACHDALLYDVAIAVNDWCMGADSTLDTEKTAAFLTGYQSQREISEEEKAAWSQMLRAGALRFWLSRLFDMHYPREGDMTYVKDPNVFKNILLQHIEAPQAI